jgi:hypothetical protein
VDEAHRAAAGGKRLCPRVADHHRHADRYAPEAAIISLAERLGLLEELLCALPAVAQVDQPPGSGRCGYQRVAYDHVRHDSIFEMRDSNPAITTDMHLLRASPQPSRKGIDTDDPAYYSVATTGKADKDAVDLETGAIVGMTVQDAEEGESHQRSDPECRPGADRERAARRPRSHRAVSP